jgi:hypothetical protein
MSPALNVPQASAVICIELWGPLRSIENIMKKHAKRDGIKKMTPHTLQQKIL